MWKARGNHHINIPSYTTTILSSEIDSRSLKNLFGRKIAPHSDVRVGTALQNTCDRNKTQIIGKWNVQTMLKTGKLENIKIEMERLDIDILGLCEYAGQIMVNFGLMISELFIQIVQKNKLVQEMLSTKSGVRELRT